MICIYYAKDGLTAEPCNVLNAGKSENDGSYTDTDYVCVSTQFLSY